MQQSPFAFIDDVIGQIPVVGPMWADALHVFVGVSQAMNMAALRDEAAPYPAPAARVDTFGVPSAPPKTTVEEALLRAA
jgi:hypothetical protein